MFLFQTAETGNRTPNSGVKGSGANHYPRAPALPIRMRTYPYSTHDVRLDFFTGFVSGMESKEHVEHFVKKYKKIILFIK